MRSVPKTSKKKSRKADEDLKELEERDLRNIIAYWKDRARQAEEELARARNRNNEAAAAE